MKGGVFARARSGIAARRLAPVWFGLGVIAFAIGIYLSLGSVSSISGSVLRVEPMIGPFSQPEIAVTIPPSRRIFLLVNNEPPLPDIRVGDHVEMWVKGTYENDLWGLAFRSQRGTWVDYGWDTNVRFFTPETWYIHEIVRTSGFAFGPILAIFGLVLFSRTTRHVGPDQSSRPDRLPLIMLGLVILVLLLGSCLFVLDSLRGLT